MSFSIDHHALTETRSGIPSVSSQTRRPRIATTDELRAFAEVVTNDSLEVALETLKGRSYRDELIDALFKTRTEPWRFVINDRIGGQCLVVNDGVGKRSLLLAECWDEIYTTGESLAELEVLQAVATATGKENVQPIHGAVEEIPFPPETFDTILYTHDRGSLGRTLERLHSLLKSDGKLLVHIHGWPRTTGLTKFLGMEPRRDRFQRSLTSLFTANSARHSRRIRSSGFAIDSRYALLSSRRHENEWLFEIEDDEALKWVLHGADKAAIRGVYSMVRAVAFLANRVRVLQQCYPAYLFVCSPKPNRRVQSRDADGEIFMAGKNRTTALELADGEVRHVRKIPNSLHQSELNENLADLLNRLNSTDEEITDTLPSGEAVETRFGCEWHEQPVSGTPLSQLLTREPDAYEENVEIALDWLAKFQLAFSEEDIQRTPIEIKSSLTLPAFGLEPPSVPDTPLSSRSGPMHGDFFGSNIYVEDDQVSHVIDWEWTKPREPPVADAGFFLLQSAESLSDEFTDGFETAFVDDTPYREITQGAIDRYCEMIDITATEFVTYLPYGYLTRIRQDLEYNYRLDIDWPERVDHIWGFQDRLFEIYA